MLAVALVLKHRLGPSMKPIVARISDPAIAKGGQAQPGVAQIRHKQAVIGLCARLSGAGNWEAGLRHRQQVVPLKQIHPYGEAPCRISVA